MSRTDPDPMAGFQVIIYGRFWVIAEVFVAMTRILPRPGH